MCGDCDETDWPISIYIVSLRQDEDEDEEKRERLAIGRTDEVD